MTELAVYRVDEPLVPGLLKRVPGEHPSLKYRGNAIKRDKIWAQRPPLSAGILRYYYTGWQWDVIDATAHASDSPLLTLAFDKANELAKYNHLIYTWYDTLSDNIGQHADKTKDIAPDCIILVVRMGPRARDWVITDAETGVAYSTHRSNIFYLQL